MFPPASSRCVWLCVCVCVWRLLKRDLYACLSVWARGSDLCFSSAWAGPRAAAAAYHLPWIYENCSYLVHSVPGKRQRGGRAWKRFQFKSKFSSEVCADLSKFGILYGLRATVCELMSHLRQSANGNKISNKTKSYYSGAGHKSHFH